MDTGRCHRATFAVTRSRRRAISRASTRDTTTRVMQEILLGVGGVRLLRELGLQPSTFHMNEGHSAFLAVERIRVLMAGQDLTFTEALEASRGNNVFTTHTPIPAGIDTFPPALVE